jgi:hypothetical protein
MKVREIRTGTSLLQTFNVFRKKSGILNCAGGAMSLIGEPSNSRAPVHQHRCRGGCSFGKMNLFILPGVCPHRHSPMSIRFLSFPLFFAPWRLGAMQNLFGSSTEPCGYRGYNPLPQNMRKPEDIASWSGLLYGLRRNTAYRLQIYKGPDAGHPGKGAEDTSLKIRWCNS